MKYYYLLVFVFLFAKVFAQNNDDSDVQVVSTGIDDADAEEALYKHVETLRQFCEHTLNETEDVNVRNFNLLICQAFAQVNAGDTSGAYQTVKDMFADKTLSATQKKEILEKHQELMKEIQESVGNRNNNDASNSNAASNSNGASNNNNG
uniref:Uncharacterized protein n=1 Tax=Acrobeloides nanus TaxID=290746 RepID=A0A914C117_9BILA